MARVLSFLSLFLIYQLLYGQPSRFFSSDEELSNSMITSITQDGSGFIWIATEDGLNRFDGLNFRQYRRISDDPSSLLSNFVRTLFSDSQGRLLVGCINGLMVYIPETNPFREVPLYRDTIRVTPHITSIIESARGDIIIATSGQGIIRIEKDQNRGFVDIPLGEKLSSIFLETIYEDYLGRLWIGTENKGLNLYDPTSGRLKVFHHEKGKEKSPGSDYITSIAEDHRRNIYIGTINGGISRYNEADSTFTFVPAQNGNIFPLPVRRLYTDSNNTLWAGTIGAGLWQLNHTENRFEQRSVTSHNLEINRSSIHCIAGDNEGNLWLGIYLKGVLMLQGGNNGFNTLPPIASGQKGPGTGTIMTIATDAENQIWVGTDTEGIFRIDHNTGESVKYNFSQQISNILPPSVSAIVADDKGNLYIGTSLDGLIVYNPKTRQTRVFRHQPDNPYSLSNDKVQCLARDRSGHIWIGTSGGGLNRFDPVSQRFTRYQEDIYDVNSLANNWVNTLFFDSEGLLWIGTYNRLSVYNPATSDFLRLSTSNHLLPDNIVYTITESSDGRIWIGTNDGLARYDKGSRRSRFFNVNDGLSNNVITAILEDESGRIWISTHNGLSCYNPDENSFGNFYVHDGLQGNEFRRNSALRNHNGELFFGGINGLTWFIPGQITRDAVPPSLYLTDLILHNNKVEIGEIIDRKLLLPKALNSLDELILTWQQKNFSIEFSTIGFNNPERIQYQYRLMGFHNSWITTGYQNRRATYTNLQPGRYTFELRAVDGDQFSATRSLAVVITPPWWSAWWFRTIYILLALLLV